MILMTDNEATRTTFVRTWPALNEARCYEAEAENFGLGLVRLEDLTAMVILLHD